MYQIQPASRGAVSTQSLLAQVLGITALGMCVTALAAYLFPNVSPMVGLAAFFGGFILLFVITAVQRNEPLALTLFYVFAFLEGIGLAPTIHRYVVSVGADVVYNAAIVTGLGMFVLAALVYATGLDLRRFQGIVMLALLGLVIVGIASAFLHFIHPTVYAWLTLVIFTALVLIDFARIRAGGDGRSPVSLALSIYLDAINIFLALLQIFGGRRSND